MDNYFSTIPAITKVLLGVNIGVYVLMFLSSSALPPYMINAHLVIDEYEYYRVFSSAFVHSGIMHIFMNMTSLLQLGASIETQFGSMLFLSLSIWSVILIGFLYVSLCWIAAIALSDPSQMYVGGVGYSGVLFCYAVIDSYHTTETTRSVFGLFSVPAKVYPFILLIILQFVLPNISFIGHASGIIVGMLAVSGILEVVLPSLSFLEFIETTPNTALLCYCNKISNYVYSPNKSYTHSSFGGSLNIWGIISSARVVLSFIISHLYNIVITVLLIVIPTSIVKYCQSVRDCIRSTFDQLYRSCVVRTGNIFTFNSSNGSSGSSTIQLASREIDRRGTYTAAYQRDIEDGATAINDDSRKIDL